MALKFFRDCKSRHDGLERMFVDIGDADWRLSLQPIDIPKLSGGSMFVKKVIDTE